MDDSMDIDGPSYELYMRSTNSPSGRIIPPSSASSSAKKRDYAEYSELSPFASPPSDLSSLPPPSTPSRWIYVNGRYCYGPPSSPSPEPVVEAVPPRRVGGMLVTVYDRARGFFSSAWSYITGAKAQEVVAVENKDGSKRRAVSLETSPPKLYGTMPGTFPDTPMIHRQAEVATKFAQAAQAPQQLITPPDSRPTSSQEQAKKHDSPMAGQFITSQPSDNTHPPSVAQQESNPSQNTEPPKPHYQKREPYNWNGVRAIVRTIHDYPLTENEKKRYLAPGEVHRYVPPSDANTKPVGYGKPPLRTSVLPPEAKNVPPTQPMTIEKRLGLSVEEPKLDESTSSITSRALRNAEKDAQVDGLLNRLKKAASQSPDEKALRRSYGSRLQQEAEEAEKQKAKKEVEEAAALTAQHEAEEAARQKAEQDAQEAAKQKARKDAEEALMQKAQKDVKEGAIQKTKKEIAEAAAQKARQDAEEARLKAQAMTLEDFVQADLTKKYEEEDALNAVSDAGKLAELEWNSKQQLIRPLDPQWDVKVGQAMDKGANTTLAKTVDGIDLTRYAFGTLLPQAGSNDRMEGWLNDDIVNGWMSAISTRKQEQTGYVKSATSVPPYQALSSHWYSNYKKKGISGISNWAKRKGIAGEKLLKCEKLFMPINSNSHWTLLIISPKARTIEYLDSLHYGDGQRHINVAREFLHMELGDKYKPEEWMEAESTSEAQRNGNDCGVFACMNALAAAKGKGYDEVTSINGMGDARRMMAAVFLNDGLKGAWDL